MLSVKQEMNRMARYDPMDQHYAKVEHMLDRMHRQTRPRTRVYILMMQIMHRFVQRRPMDRAVDPIEMELTPKWDRAQPNCAVDRVRSPIDVRDPLMRARPHKQDLVSRPHRAAANAAPENVIVRLIEKQE